MSENTRFSRLYLTLCVYSAKINVKDLNYITIGELLEPNDVIVSINSNFVHKAYPGFEKYIAKPKNVSPSKKKMMATPGYRERKKVGDGTCFQSCLDFSILIGDHCALPLLISIDCGIFLRAEIYKYSGSRMKIIGLVKLWFRVLLTILVELKHFLLSK